MDFESATLLARSRIDELARAVGAQFEILHDKAREIEQGWVFFFNTTDFVRTRNPMSALAGNGPILVTRSGVNHELPSSIPWEDAVQRIAESTVDPVLKVIEVGPLVCVLSEPSPNASNVPNLFMLDAEGRLLWKASASFAAGNKNVFVDARLDPNDPSQILAWDWDGNRYVFAASSGQQLKREFFK